MTRIEELEHALAAVSWAARKQLEGMGKGKEPSETLQRSLDWATSLLGRDPTETRPSFPWEAD